MASGLHLSTGELLRRSCLIDPRTGFKPRWDTFIAVLVLTTLIAIPLQIAFDNDEDGATFSSFSIAITCADMLFCCGAPALQPTAHGCARHQRTSAIARDPIHVLPLTCDGR